MHHFVLAFRSRVDALYLLFEDDEDDHDNRSGVLDIAE